MVIRLRLCLYKLGFTYAGELTLRAVYVLTQRESQEQRRD
jgi:hypothetical protein